MNKIFLLGAYGQNNLGDDALLEVFLEQLRDSQVVVNSAQPAETQRRHGIAAVTTYSKWPRPSWLRTLFRADAIVFGGGSLLKEIEGGFIGRMFYFLRIFILLGFGKLFGRPTAMLGVGIGPLAHPLYRWLARRAANLTGLVCVRDNESRDLLLTLGVRRPIHVTADPVFTLAALDRVPATRHSERPLLVVVPRYSLTAAQVAALAEACDHMAATHSARIVMMPFQTGYQAKYDDASAARATIAHMRHADAAELYVPATPRAAIAMIAGADLVLSARLHGLIFAATQGVAMVALDYEIKVRSFMHELGAGWASVGLSTLEAGQLPAVLDDAWARRTELGAQLRAKIAGLRASSQRNFELFHELVAQPRAGGALGGGALLFASMTIVNIGNYLFNLVLGRWLGPAAFADLSLVITLMLVITMITATLQTISAKFSAMYAASGDDVRLRAVRAWLSRCAWLIGVAMLAAFALGGPIWQHFFQTTSAWPFVILGLGLPLYFAQGVDRGVLQGRTSFGALSLSYQAEMWVRLVAAIAFVAVGWSVNGAVAGVTLSLIAAWLVGFWMLDVRGSAAGLRLWKRRGASAPTKDRLQPADRTAVIAFAGPVIAALVGQVLINNSDILIVKHFFPAAEAGQYAALALIGRIVFFATVSVVATMFPIVAQKQQRGEPHRHLLWGALGLVAAASLAVIGAALVVPDLMVQILFGAAYLPIAPLLWLYAVATMLYALANVVINYRLSAGDGGGSSLAIIAGAAQAGGLWLFHSSLREVVVVQIVLMVGLFLALLVWDRRLASRASAAAPAMQLTSRAALGARRWRTIAISTVSLLVLLLMWQVASAQAPQPSNAPQQQIKLILPSLRDSEAEQATGAYIPQIGALITLDLIRGPNTLQDKPANSGVHDWAMYLMGAFGPKLSAVPPDETIAISINYYNFDERTYHQQVITCRAADAADSTTYRVWLDGQPYDQAMPTSRAIFDNFVRAST